MSLYRTDELAQKISILKQTNHTDMNITVEQLVNFGRFPYCKGSDISLSSILTVPLSILINFVIADSKVLFPAPLGKTN
jgi:ABC-type enterochelin transport system ATPase subunit